MPTKKSSELVKILGDKFKGMVTQEECVQILRYIYKDDDFNDINEKLEKNLQIAEAKVGPG